METQHRFASQRPLDCSVLTTWTLLFARLEERSSHAAKLLILWGFLDNRDIWNELFTSALTLNIASELPEWHTDCVNDYSTFIECTQLFVLYSFIDVKVGSSSFSVDPVLHQWCFQASKENKADMAWLAFVLFASSSLDRTTTDYTLIQRRLLPHCDRLSFLLRDTIPKAPCDEEESSLDIARHFVGGLYFDQGKLREAENMFVRALTGKETALGSEHTSTLATVNDLGILYRGQGKLREAGDMYMRALTGYEKALGPEHISTLHAVNNLGVLYSYQDKLREAEDMFMRALAGYEKTFGPEHTLILKTLNNLGTLYEDQGKLREAEDMYVRALLGHEKAFGPEHTSTLRAVYNLGVLYGHQKKLREAEAMYMRALAGYEKALGPEHQKTAIARRNIANLKNPPKSKAFRRGISRLFKKEEA